ncbi:MAG: acyloxyacyl hydrolase [Alistipes sp.]|nr:acyloxyacyl hydrolase [Alistipes sp.]
MERKAVIILCTIIATLLGLSTSRAESPKWCDSLSHRVGIELRPAYNMVSHYALNNGTRPLNNALSFHARYAFSFDPESSIGRRYPTAYQGVGIAAYTLWSHKTTGTPMVAYIMQGARIADLSNTLSLGYEWNFGISWGWHPNEAMNARCNVMINVALPLTWRITPQWELSLTPDYTHFSNGDTAFSNSGANMFGLRLGATYLFNEGEVKASARRFIVASEELSTKSFADHMTYDIVLYGAWRADRFSEGNDFFVINKALPIVGINFQPTYQLNNYFGLGASLDIQADSSLNLYDGINDDDSKTVSYSRPPLWQQMEVGVSLRGEIRAPIFTIGVGFGLNMLKTGYDYSLCYTTFSLKAFLTQRLFLYVGYRFNSTQYTHNLMYGMGVRF